MSRINEQRRFFYGTERLLPSEWWPLEMILFAICWFAFLEHSFVCVEKLFSIMLVNRRIDWDYSTSSVQYDIARANECHYYLSFFLTTIAFSLARSHNCFSLKCKCFSLRTADTRICILVTLKKSDFKSNPSLLHKEFFSNGNNLCLCK